MTLDPTLQNQLTVIFSALNKKAAGRAFPPPLSLSLELEKCLASATANPVYVGSDIGLLFATAAVDMWHRAVHSYLISASVTVVSPIWASVCGYYASHYSVRAIAHLLGYFQMFRRRQIVQIVIHRGKFMCHFVKKTGGDREHRLYWKLVKESQNFKADPWFTVNNPSLDESDVSHRDKANYADHLVFFPHFKPLDEAELRRRLDQIAQMEVAAPPIPRVSKLPDVDAVQIVAYRRLVRFRRLLDEAVGDSNRFWRLHRTPGWAADMLNFQVTETPILSAPTGS